MYSAEKKHVQKKQRNKLVSLGTRFDSTYLHFLLFSKSMFGFRGVHILLFHIQQLTKQTASPSTK